MNQTKQKQTMHSNDLMRSFKATTNLAQSLTKDRVHIQHDLQKISHGKEQLEELKKLTKVKEPVLTAEEKASIANKADIKFTGFNMQMTCSQKGKDMIERQRDSRRQRHIETLKESEKFVEQFYDNFSEKRNEIRERVKIFFAGSDVEIDGIMKGLTDELLLANEIAYVNGIWEKVSQHRQARQEEIAHLRASLDDLKSFQQKGSGGYLKNMRENLINIAFFLEPAVDELIREWVNREQNKYESEHQQNDEFYNEVVAKEQAKFELLYTQWKESVVRFHILKQQDAIASFLDRLNSKEFVNPPSRVQLFATLKDEQLSIYKQRMELITQLSNSPTHLLNKDYISQIDDRLKQINDDAQTIFDKIVEDLAKDMENTNEDADIALYDLKDFLQKNDAQLEEGQTFESIIEDQAQPTVDRRKVESKTLVTNAVKYMEDFDFKMNEICQNIVNFFRDLATKLDSNKEKLKQTEINFQVSLAQCGDSYDEVIQSQEDELQVKVEEMRRAIHHVELNEKLQVCFDMLDQITKSYRNYNAEYINLVNEHPTTMDAFYNDFEKDCLSVYKVYEEGKRADIQLLFQQETEARQKKLEEAALKKWEEEKKAEELKKAEEDKNKPAGKAPAKPAAAPQKKGKEPEKPPIDVPKLEVPKVQDFSTPMGNKYIVERSLEEISQKIQDTNQEEQPNAQDGSEQVPGQQTPVQQPPVQPVQQQQQPTTKPGQQNQQQQQQQPPVPAQPEEQVVLEEPVAKFLPNDYLDKAQLSPPQDPEGVECLHPNLLITPEEIISLLTSTLDKLLDYLNTEKQNYQKQVARNGKDLIDKNVDELDENLRKQWPRKGKLEVEVYQERKSQITAHNKKYERQVRTCLEKYNTMDEQWSYIIETLENDFLVYQQQQEKLRVQLPEGKNLAELQGVSRREKDSCQTFEEKCREFQDKLYDLGVTQPDILIQQNNEMLSSCQLFEKGGNYSELEVDWYRGQMQEINDMIVKCKEERDQKQKEIHLQMEKLIKEPVEKFDKDYKASIQSLSAKEGLGKTYGQPRRLAQEKIRAEMTKCESAQKGVDQLLDKLEKLSATANSEYAHDYGKEKVSLSMEIRMTLVTLLRCIVHYGVHLGAFVKEPKQLQRITYSEKQAELELTPAEIPIDEKRKEEELENLGAIGFKNATQVQLKFPEMVQQIEKTSKELCVKLYTGENAKFLVGPEKIPEYLSVFFENMRRQCEEFRIGSVRQLRTTALQLVELCQQIPRSVLGYLCHKYATIIAQKCAQEDKAFSKAKEQDDDSKEKHLKLFRPNLENPANKSLTAELNQKEIARTEAFKELIDEVQLKMLDIEQFDSLEFYNAFLNNVRGLIRIYDCLLYKEDFIMLPGDEIVEKKHQNIKMLTAQLQKQDLSKRSTRKWPGLGANVFDIDYAALFDQYRDMKYEPEGQAQVPVTEEKKNELSHEIEIQNTDHHKAIVKARNEFYEQFKRRFEGGVRDIMKKFDDLRKEELRFNSYWAQNLKEITQKHI